MFEHFTDRSRKVVALANQQAQRLQHNFIGTEHLLLGMIKEGDGVGVRAMKKLGLKMKKVWEDVEKRTEVGPTGVSMGRLPQTPLFKRVMENAIEESRTLQHDHVGTEHLLLGMLQEQDGIAGQTLRNMGLNLEDTRQQVIDLVTPPQKKENAKLD